MKKIRILVLALSLLLFLSGCQGASKESNYDYTTSAVSNDPLVICVDLENFTVDGGSTYDRDLAMNEFIYTLEHTGGLTDVAIQFIPPKGAERKTYIDRLRVEIMAGVGPDVFLMAYNNGLEMAYNNGLEDDGSLNLFEYPQKVMETGLFLPLDEYMENNTRFTEWDKQTQGVMAAGRNEEGQQIIPLSYSLPVICYPKTQVEYTPDRELSWNDMLTDPVLSPLARDLANCCDYSSATLYIPEEVGFYPAYMEYILGEMVDFEEEELLFTEEELLQRVNEILALDTDDINDDPEDKYNGAIEEWLGLGLSSQYFNKPLTMIPMYSDDGGVTARIDAFAAVNRNTQRPEEAFTVIDVLMSKKVQQNHRLYYFYLYGFYSLPMHEDLFTQEAPLCSEYMTDENHQELCEVRDQITGANFAGRYRSVLNEEMLFRCRDPEAYGTTVEEIVHEVYEDLQRRVRE